MKKRTIIRTAMLVMLFACAFCLVNDAEFFSDMEVIARSLAAMACVVVGIRYFAPVAFLRFVENALRG